MLLGSTYSPPCWVNPTLQKRLSAPIKTSNILKIGRELWEASGGGEEGFQEFFKYVSQLNGISHSLAQKMWHSCTPVFRTKKSRIPLSPLSPAFERLCPDCVNVIPPGKNICSRCSDVSDIIIKVVKCVLD